MRIRNKNRRGITLLFVISMIVLFLLMGTTFLIVSNDYFRAAKKRAKSKIFTVDTTALVHRSFFKIVRGSDLTEVDSPMRGIDLLSDQYGYGFKASVRVAAPVDAGRLQLIQLQIHEDSGIDNGRQILGLRSLLADAAGVGEDFIGGDPLGSGLFDYSDPAKVNRFRPELDTPGYFAGQVLTFVSGPAKGVSARIVDYTVTIDTSGPSAIRSFVIVPERLPNGAGTPFENNPVTINGVNTTGIESLGDVRDGGGNLVNTPSQVVINGRAFSGLGSGVRGPNAMLPENEFDPSQDWAYRPNNARFNDPSDPMGWQDYFFREYSPIANAVNEPYDAFDHNNVFLAQNLANGPAASFNPVQMAPKHYAQATTEHNRFSFRPVFQWDPSSPGTPASNNTANQFFPNVLDTNATSPPAGWNGEPHELQSRPLDVDNDYDGVADSVWIDMGHEAITLKDGRLVKPLVAAMVIDLDSRLNVNAHGNFADAESRAMTLAGGFMTNANLLGPNSTTPANSLGMNRGLGWGPAEVSLAPLFMNQDYRQLLVGYTTLNPDSIFPFDQVPVLPGRYGYDRFPGNSYFDFAAQFRFSDHPSFGTIGGSFKSRPMDIQGRFATGFPAAYETHTIPDPNPVAPPGSTINVDVPYGMPIADIATSTWPPVGPYSNADPMNPYPGFGTEIYNSPYESALYQESRRGDDLLFTPDELEAMLRTFDIDSQLLYSRLAEFNVTTNKRHLITTDSYEVPALPPTIFQTRTGPVNETIPQRMYNILKVNNPGLAHDEIFKRMRGGIPGPPASNIVHSLLSHEVMRGLPMNVNRIFGDGADNDGDGITDEHWNSGNANENEAVSETYPLTAIGLDHNNDGASDFQDRFARQIFARHLFVLTWLTTSEAPEGAPPFNPQIPDVDNDGDNDDDDIAFLAQWCANVVDFRDADSICTPFKYDKNPWDGWDEGPNVTGSDPEPYDGSDPDVGVVWGLERPELLITEALATHERRYTENPPGTWISDYVPKASVFVELYNPWATNGNTESAPAEFYNGGGIDLGRHTNSLNGGGVEDPVWRLSFTEVRDTTPAGNPVDTSADPSRRVYFLEPSTSVEGNDNGTFFYPTSTYGTIPPNGYAVVGSSGIETASGEFRTTFGRRSDADELSDLLLDETRSITLVPNVGVDVTDWDGSAMTTVSRQCVVVPIDSQGRGADYTQRSLGITDPLVGYDPTGTMLNIIDPDGDGDPSDGDGFKFIAPAGKADPVNNPVDTDGMSHGFRYVHLQRLANPEVAYDSVTNPYVTVDIAPIDVFSFNGLAATNSDVSGNGGLDFDSHERGETQNGTLRRWDTGFDGAGIEPQGNDRVLWPEEDLRTGMSDVAPITTDLHFLSQEFDESFGLLNETYRGSGTNPANVSTKPFPWLAWNNRPYVSQYELGNVPMFRAREVLNNYSANGSNHLVQFNDTTLKRVFEFLEVPPRFVASEVGFQATAFNGETLNNSLALFNAPYNYTSRYRYPGKVNINTITRDINPPPPAFTPVDQRAVWNSGMMANWGIGYNTLTDPDIMTPNQPGGVRGDAARNNDPTYPTSHTGIHTYDSEDPLRSDGVASFDLPRAIDDPETLGSGEADGSLLRTNAGGADNFFRATGAAYNDPTRNNAFYSAPVTKLANISTNRSSCYAIWITVGYFEIDQAGLLGAEVGSDTGEVKRNRGFYIFDRSIPMAFEPGKNHNVERGILVQSIIE